MKKISHLAIGPFILLALVAIPSTGCITVHTTPTSKQVSLSEATMCRSVDAEYRPLDKTDVFVHDVPKIYCSVKVSNAPPDTEVKAQWIYVQGEREELINKVLVETPGTVRGTKYLAFEITQGQGFPVGDWVVKFFLDGKEKLTVPFKVQGGAAVPVQPAGVSLPNIFQEPGFLFTMRYPADWTYQIVAKGLVQFRTKKSPQSVPVVSFQNLASTKIGGQYANTDAVINELTNGIKAADRNAKITDLGTHTVAGADGQGVIMKMRGFEYTYQGQTFKRLLAVVPHNSSEEIFHSIYCESLLSTSDAYKATFQAMMDSLTLTK